MIFNYLEKNKNLLKQVLFCFLISLLFLLIKTKCSPLYNFNDWVDVNCFFTVGKSMLNGVVLYQDIFEQKGPLLFYIFGIAYLISSKTLIGVYFIEVLFFTVFLYSCLRIVSLFIQKKYILLTVPMMAFLILDLNSFVQGGSAEEISLPFLGISLYHIIRYFKFEYPKSPNLKMVLINGIIAGCILWIKYSMLGFWFGWMLAILIGLVLQKKYLDIIKVSTVFLVGMFISTLPWIIYFAKNDALYDWINTYIYINFSVYRVKLGFFETIIFVFDRFFSTLFRNIHFLIILFFGLIYYFRSKIFFNINLTKLLVFTPFIFLIIGVYGGGQDMRYYFLIISPMIIFGVISFVHFIDSFSKGKIPLKINLTVITTMIMLFFTFVMNDNKEYLYMKKDDYCQYTFAEIIEQTPNATLLNYYLLDIGLYTTTGIVPNVKYYHRPNIKHENYPIIMDEQNRYIKERIIDYVIVRTPLDNSGDYSILDENYRIVSTKKQKFEGNYYNYNLYKAKDLF